MNADGGMQAIWRLPGPKAHSGHEFPLGAGRMKGQGTSVASNLMARINHALKFDLQPFQRRIDIARRAPGGTLLTQYMPWFQRLANLQADSALRHRAVMWKAELEVWQEPIRSQRITMVLQILNHIAKILFHKMRQHESVVQFGTPTDQRALIRMLPETGDERAEQQLLGQAHAGMGRHFKGPQFDQAKPSAAAVGRVEFINAEFCAMGVARHIDQQVAEETIDQ